VSMQKEPTAGQNVVSHWQCAVEPPPQDWWSPHTAGVDTAEAQFVQPDTVSSKHSSTESRDVEHRRVFAVQEVRQVHNWLTHACLPLTQALLHRPQFMSVLAEVSHPGCVESQSSQPESHAMPQFPELQKAVPCCVAHIALHVPQFMGSLDKARQAPEHSVKSS